MNVVVPVNPFLTLWNIGFRRLIPVMPPDARVDPTDRIFKFVDTPKDPRGKCPGMLGRDGLWHSLPGWTTLECGLGDLDRWFAAGASVGVLAGHEIVGIDADAYDETWANAIRDVIERRLGIGPRRVGLAPKAVYVFRPSERIPYTLLPFGEFADGRQTNRVEVLSFGKQFVVWGTHPKTGRPYSWPGRLPPLAEIPMVSAEDVRMLMEELRETLPLAGAVSESGSAAGVDQDTLRAPDVEMVRAAVRATRNTSAAFPTRESYVEFGYLIKAALPDAPSEAFAIYADWCAAWEDGANDPDTVESDWSRMKGPYKAGASKLFEIAARESGGIFTAASSWFEPLLAEPEPLFPAAADEPRIDEEGLSTVRASAWAAEPVPAQTWLVRDMAPARGVTLLYGDGGTGKSLAALQLCFACATGGAWFGLAAARGPALFLTAEDELEELHRRLAAIVDGTGFLLSDLDDLHMASLHGRDAVLAAPNVKTGLMEATALLKRLRATLARLRPVVVVLDTLADLFGGDENRRIQARQFIQLLQGLTVGLDFDLSVILLAHPSVAGMQSGSGTSGNTAWSNSVRSRLYLERRFATQGEKRIEIDPDVRVLSTKKANRTRSGSEIMLRWTAGRFETVDAPEALDEVSAADEVIFLTILDEMSKAGRNVSDNLASSNFAGRVFESHPLGAIGRERLGAAMTRLMAQGALRVSAYGSKSRGNRRLERQE